MSNVIYFNSVNSIRIVVYIVATAKKLPSGNWRVQLYLGRDEQKRKIIKSFTGSTKREAELAAALYSHEKENSPKLTVGNAISRFIDAKSAVLSPKTIREYRSIERNAFPSIKSVEVSQINNEQVQRAVNEYAVGRSPKSVRNALSLLTASLSLIAPEKHIRVTLPRPQKTSINIPTDAQIKALLDAASPHLKTAILFASALGMRRSEICALSWDDIDMEKRTLRINKAVVYSEDGLWITKSTKTASSTRRLDLPDFIIAHIRSLPHDNERVVPVTPDTITRAFHEIRKPIGITCRFHDLRHYYASLLLALGVPDKYAMDRMGHATTNMLKTVYQHIMKEKQDEISQKTNEEMGKRFT